MTGIIVVLVLALCAVGAVVARSGSDGGHEASRTKHLPPLTDEVRKDLVIVSAGPGAGSVEGPGTLYLLREGQPIGNAQSFGHGTVVPIGRLPHPEVPAPISTEGAGPGGLFPIAGGAVVAWSDEGKVTVAAVPLGRGPARTLYEGGDTTGIGLSDEDADGDQRILIEDGGDCYESTGGEAYLVGYGSESCRFQRTGEIIVGEAVGNGQQRFTVLDAEGIPLSELEPTGTSAEVVGSAVAVRQQTGSGQTLALADLETGRALDDFETSEYPGGGRTWDDTELLLPWASDDPLRARSVGIDLVNADGKVETVAKGPWAAARIGQDGIVVAGSGDWKTTRVMEGEREVISGPGADFEVLPGHDGTSDVVAWDRSGRVLFGSARAPLRKVGTVKGLTELSQISTVRDHSAVYALTDQHRLVRIDPDGVVQFDGSWSDVEVADAGARGALVVATHAAEGGGHGNEQALLLVQGAEASVLDEGRIAHPRFDESDVIYQRASTTSGDDVEIRRVSARSRSAEPETIQRGAAIALPVTVHPVWRAGDGGPRWLTVSGCGVLPPVTPFGSYNGPTDRPTTACIAGGGEGATLTLAFSTDDPIGIVIESDGRTVAALDGPVDRKEIRFHTDGGPTLVRTTAVPGGENGWLMDIRYQPDS